MPNPDALGQWTAQKIMQTETPNSQQPANGGNESGQEQKPVLGTTPTSQQVQKPAPTSDTKPEGTEGEQKPNTPPQDNKGEGGDQKPQINYEEKFAESSREAQRLMDVLKAAGIDPKTGKPIEAPKQDEKPPEEGTQPAQEPTREAPQYEAPVLTDEELSKAIPGFANMSEGEKALLRDIKGTTKIIASMQRVLAEIVDEREYNKGFTGLTKKEEWKKIAEFADEFKEFAYTKDNLKVPLETLAASFLYKKGLGTQKPEEKPAPSGVESGGAGKGEEKGTKDEGFTADEAAEIRRNDPKRYQQLVRSGKMKIRDEE